VSCPREVDVGAYVLDALEPEERLRVAEHLRCCTACSRTLAELGTLAPLLAAVPPGDVPGEAPAPSELAFQRLRRSAVGVRAPRRRNRRLLAVAAAAVLVTGGLGVGAGMAMTSRPPGPTTVQASSGSVHAWATITARGTGSGITLSLDGLPRGTTCWLVAVGRDGERARTASWTVDDDGDLHWSGTVALARDQLVRLEVAAAGGRTIVALPA
jgi:hypothetical protein